MKERTKQGMVIWSFIIGFFLIGFVLSNMGACVPKWYQDYSVCE